MITLPHYHRIQIIIPFFLTSNYFDIRINYLNLNWMPLLNKSSETLRRTKLLRAYLIM